MASDAEIEESKMLDEPLLEKGESDIIFTTVNKDTKNPHVKSKPLCFVASNIPSYMGGRANLWGDSGNRVAI